MSSSECSDDCIGKERNDNTPNRKRWTPGRKLIESKHVFIENSTLLKGEDW